MSDEVPETELSLARIITNARYSTLEEPSSSLRRAARDLQVAIKNRAPEWAAAQATLRQTTDQNKVNATSGRRRFWGVGFLAEVAVATLTAVLAEEVTKARKAADGLEEAEADLRRQLPKIASQLPQIETAADKITADPGKRKAIERISAIVKETEASKLSSFALLVILWWVLGLTSPENVAALAVWHAIARDVLTKKKD